MLNYMEVNMLKWNNTYYLKQWCSWK